MTAQIQERYRPIPMAANSTMTTNANQLGGFLAVTTGTLTVVDSNGATVVAGVGVTAGVYTPMPFMIGGGGAPSSVALAGGASGTLGIA